MCIFICICICIHVCVYIPNRTRKQVPSEGARDYLDAGHKWPSRAVPPLQTGKLYFFVQLADTARLINCVS